MTGVYELILAKIVTIPGRYYSRNGIKPDS